MSTDRKVEYSIRVTAQLTGISPDQLRVWERRYGFPAPERSAAGARCYNQQDVERLRLIAKALRAGWRARDAVLSEPGTLRRMLATAARDSVAAAEPTPELPLKRLVERLQNSDVGSLKLTLRQLAASCGPKAFVVDVVGPLVREVGDAWSRGEIEVRHEHLMTEVLSSQLRLLASAYDDSQQRSPVVLLATLPDEQHGLGLEMAALYLAADGAQPRLLGTDTPQEEIVHAAAELRADIVGLSVSGAVAVRDAALQVEQLRAGLPPETGLWIGGAGALAVSQNLPGVVALPDFRAVDAALNRFRVGA